MNVQTWGRDSSGNNDLRVEFFDTCYVCYLDIFTGALMKRMLTFECCNNGGDLIPKKKILCLMDITVVTSCRYRMLGTHNIVKNFRSRLLINVMKEKRHNISRVLLYPPLK